jgi:hypothetical protein
MPHIWKGQRKQKCCSGQHQKCIEKALLKALYDFLTVILKQFAMRSGFAKGCTGGKN